MTRVVAPTTPRSYVLRYMHMVPDYSVCANSKSAEFANSPDFPFQGGPTPARSACFSGHPLKAPQGYLLPATAAYAHPGGRSASLPIALLPGNRQAIQQQLRHQAGGQMKRNTFFQSALFLERYAAILAIPFRFLRETKRFGRFCCVSFSKRTVKRHASRYFCKFHKNYRTICHQNRLPATSGTQTVSVSGGITICE